MDGDVYVCVYVCVYVRLTLLLRQGYVNAYVLTPKRSLAKIYRLSSVGLEFS
jgi:hypothetical protein